MSLVSNYTYVSNPPYESQRGGAKNYNDQSIVDQLLGNSSSQNTTNKNQITKISQRNTLPVFNHSSYLSTKQTSSPLHSIPEESLKVKRKWDSNDYGTNTNYTQNYSPASAASNSTNFTPTSHSSAMSPPLTFANSSNEWSIPQPTFSLLDAPANLNKASTPTFSQNYTSFTSSPSYKPSSLQNNNDTQTGTSNAYSSSYRSTFPSTTTNYATSIYTTDVKSYGVTSPPQTFSLTPQPYVKDSSLNNYSSSLPSSSSLSTTLGMNNSNYSSSFSSKLYDTDKYTTPSYNSTIGTQSSRVSSTPSFTSNNFSAQQWVGSSTLPTLSTLPNQYETGALSSLNNDNFNSFQGSNRGTFVPDYQPYVKPQSFTIDTSNYILTNLETEEKTKKSKNKSEEEKKQKEKDDSFCSVF